MSFQPRYYTRDNKPGGQPSDTADITNCHKAGDSAPHVVAYGVSENQRAEVKLTPYSRQITSGGGKPGQGYPCVAIRNSGRDADMRPGRTGTTTQEDVMFSLQAEQQHTIAFPGMAHKGWPPPSMPIDENRTGPLDTKRAQCVSASWGVRRLTPTECERLQGFPDGHTAGQSDSAAYRQLGNAVEVDVAEWIGRRIVQVLQHPL